MDKYYEAWEVVYDLAKELMEKSETMQRGLQLLQASNIVLDRSGEEQHKEHIRILEELKAEREQTVRQPKLRTIEAQPQPMPLLSPRPRRKPMEKPDGYIAAVVETEWGTFFNIKQTPS